MSYTPDRWVVLEFSSEQYGTIRKVFGGWYGSFTGSDSWKLNSGIVAVTKHDKVFEFEGSSGSVYACHEGAYGLSGYMTSIFSSWQEEFEKSGAKIRILSLEETAEL